MYVCVLSSGLTVTRTEVFSKQLANSTHTGISPSLPCMNPLSIQTEIYTYTEFTREDTILDLSSNRDLLQYIYHDNRNLPPSLLLHYPSSWDLPPSLLLHYPGSWDLPPSHFITLVVGTSLPPSLFITLVVGTSLPPSSIPWQLEPPSLPLRYSGSWDLPPSLFITLVVETSSLPPSSLPW